MGCLISREWKKAWTAGLGDKNRLNGRTKGKQVGWERGLAVTQRLFLQTQLNSSRNPNQKNL